MAELNRGQAAHARMAAHIRAQRAQLRGLRDEARRASSAANALTRDIRHGAGVGRAGAGPLHMAHDAAADAHIAAARQHAYVAERSGDVTRAARHEALERKHRDLAKAHNDERRRILGMPSLAHVGTPPTAAAQRAVAAPAAASLAPGGPVPRGASGPGEASSSDS